MIGYGNPLREDDGFGPAVVERLRCRDLATCTLFSCHQLTPEIAEKLVGFERLVFVDAALGETAGVLAVPLEGMGSLTGMSHRISPLIVIKTLEMLYAQRSDYLIFSYLTECLGYRGMLSREASVQAERLSLYLAELCGGKKAVPPGGS